ncbi:hypothetical protein [Variovorax ginsengisoli]|uniref:Uncharacterized protein n=1 Tax=Variovorax ginsengisoli TaxID=363844 RepID=A0ABT8S684_9BURK|nr:hypothetical protein [Variovorax ginsengisoli]MDN8614327.1 hypothetical protein [Variovorax ginsengisoli]MDO1533497.1 hypothetical protein [Variovorax ginsengisoli]
MKLNSEHFDVEYVEAVVGPAPDACGAESLLCNYPGPGFLRLRWAEWCGLARDRKGNWLELPDTSAQRAAHKVRVAIVKGGSMAPVFVVDALRVDPPALTGPAHEVRPFSLA